MYRSNLNGALHLRLTLTGPTSRLSGEYDALIGIKVPTDKARAVVDAMEPDMGTTIATKADLQILRQDLTASFNAGFSELRQETGLLHKETALIRKDMEILSNAITVRLGSMLMLGLGLLFAALKLT